MNMKKPVDNIFAFNRGRGQDIKVTDVGPSDHELIDATQIFNAHDMHALTFKCGCNYRHCVRCHVNMTTPTSLNVHTAAMRLIDTFGFRCAGQHHVHS
jgi:hypothetical protein